MRTRLLTSAAVLLAMIVGVFTASVAAATEPVTLDQGYVTDTAGVLSSADKEAVETRLQTLTENSSADLFVVFVDDFTSPSDRVQWADTVAENNNLGPEQYLLAIAVEGRAYYISAASGGPLSDSKLDSVEERIQPLLAQNDWAGAVILAADEIQGDGGAGGMRVLLFIVGAVALALIIWLIVRGVKKRRREAEIKARGAMPERPDPNDPFSTLTDDQVAAQAGSALVQADDAITSSREELGFAVAQFGEEATAAFSGAIEQAKEKMSEAFDLKQKLDDEIEDTVHDKRAWHIRIIQICDEIDDLLDENTEAFDDLRALQQNAPAELERVRGERAALDALLPQAAPALAALSAEYAPAELATVADNPAQARERAALADRSIQAAAEAIAAGETGKAAFAIRTAEQSIAQAGQLTTTITTLQAELRDIESRAQALIAELQTDLATAAALPDTGGVISAATAGTQQQLQAAGADLAGTARSPQRALEALTAANEQIDAAIARGNATLAQARRVEQMADQTIAQATSEVRAAREFVETRRGAIGSQARTYLSQAETALSRAVSVRPTDPQAALNEAQQAHTLASRATSSARADVSGYSQNDIFGGGWTGGWGGPYGDARQSNDSGLAGDILGGIIGGLLSGGGGGFGGGSSRSSGGRSSGWRSSGGGGFRSSGFGGGGGGRSGRSGGGRF